MHVGFEEFLILSGVMLVLGLIIALDASHYPEGAFTELGTTRRAWQVGPPVLTVVTLGFGTLVAAIHWWAGRRQEVANAAAAIAPEPELPAAPEPPAPEPPSPEPVVEPAQ